MPLSDDRLQNELKRVPAWTRDGSTITRQFSLADFPSALIFVSAVGHLAEAANHHPDILVQWKKVTLTLSTHSAGGLTEKDFDLAAQIDALPIRS